MCCCSSHESGVAIVEAAKNWADTPRRNFVSHMEIFLCGGDKYRGAIADMKDQYFIFEVERKGNDSIKYDIPYSCVERIKREEILDR